ncbi:MAG TPA: GTP cyclohydrolase II [Gammaproteobacteria bacterium]|nr:GTP cyclohydrolase II [Gammaproteobacteria bacterium]
MAAKQHEKINGDPAALTFDRAVGELRRGRAVQVTDGSRGMIVAAVEAIQAALFTRLVAAGAGRAVLLVTAERAHAAGLSHQLGGPVAITFRAGVGLEQLRSAAGVGDSLPIDHSLFDVDGAPDCVPLATAGFQLAKAGRLVPALVGFETADAPGTDLIAIDTRDVEHHERVGHHSLQLVSRARVPLADAVDCEIALFRDEHSLAEHVAVLIGKPDAKNAVPVRLHSACLTGDLLASLRCDCGEQLRTAVARIAKLGGGVLLYLDQEGRGIGLPNKLRAYVLQDEGLDTVDADRHLGFLADERTYDVAAALLHELGITRIKLLTNNPQKISSLRDHGIEVAGRLPLVTNSNTHNERYLRAKTERAGHLAEEWGRSLAGDS